MTLISIVMPTFNRSAVIDDSLKSIQNQSYEHWEVIIVDDCSNDETQAIIEKYTDPRIRYIRHEKNRGGGASRNTGIRAAKGKYIAFLDSDDAWFAYKLESQLSHIESLAKPNNSVSYTQGLRSSAGISQEAIASLHHSNSLPDRRKGDNEPLSEYLFCSSGVVQTSTLMLDRELALSTLFREDLKQYQDWDFCLRLESRGAIFAFLEEPLTIRNADPSIEHISDISDSEFSESWLKSISYAVTRKAQISFLMRKVVPSLLRSKRKLFFAQKVILSASFFRLIGVRNMLKYTWKIWV